MALTRDFKKTVIARVERDPAFARALLDEAATLFLSGEPETARLILRDLVNTTLGFERLAKTTAMPSKSLHRMLSPKGNPSMDNLSGVVESLLSDFVAQEQKRRMTKAKTLEATIAVWNDFNVKMGSFSDEYSSL
jgi:DNA-binding phage protein